MDELTQTKKQVGAIFDAISPRYDRINRILSFGLDIYWRKRLAKRIPTCKSLLDLASGTCDQIHFIKRGVFKKAIALDISKGMLEYGKKKMKGREDVSFMNASALNVPLVSESQDVITMSFGIRNVLDPLKCLKEMYRLIRPGGRIFILEFSMPKSQVIKAVHIFYLRHILPKVGKLFSNHDSAYIYLNRTIEIFAHGESFAAWMIDQGFTDVKFTPMTFGVVTLYEGTKECVEY